MATSTLAAPVCRQGSFGVPISELKPSQSAVGLGEVLKKSKKIKKKGVSSPATDDGEPVPVVVGPGGKLYVTDHHHFVKALQLAKGSSALVKVNVTNNDFCKSCPDEAAKCVDEFWVKLARNRQAYLCDTKDQPISYKELPESFAPDAKPRPLENDPFRTLVYVMRKKPMTKGGSCLNRPSSGPSLMFWEFRIAERLRKSLSTASRALLTSNSETTDLPQALIDSACSEVLKPDEIPACSDRVANDPAVITGKAPSK